MKDSKRDADELGMEAKTDRIDRTDRQSVTSHLYLEWTETCR